MNSFQIKTANDVYAFVEALKAQSQKAGATVLPVQLDDALHLGSSGLEILGAIRQVLVDNRASIEQLLGASGKEQIDQVVEFIDKIFR